MPLLHGVSDKQVFFDDASVDLADGSRHLVKEDDDGVDVYPGYATTLFPDGYHVGIKGQGRHRTASKSSLSGIGRLSPDRSTIFDVTSWPTRAVVYDAATGRQRAIKAHWNHFTLAGWSARDTFFGVAERIDEHRDEVLRASQVVTCNVRTLSCTPMSPVIRANDTVLMETTSDPM